MFDVQLIASSFNDQEDEGDLPVPPAWQQRELDDESAVNPVESARSILVKSSLVTAWADSWEATIPYAFSGLWAGVTQGHAESVAATLTKLFYEQTVVGFEEERKDEPEPGQLSFDLSGMFAPSKKLTDIWMRGIKALADEGNIPLTALALAPSQTEVQQEFSKMLISLFSSIGQQLRYQSNPVVNITQAGRFTLQFQIKLCDRFFIVPDEAAEFLHVLRAELITALSSGSRIKGPWGQIAVSAAGDLIYSLIPPTTISDPSFTPAEDIE